MEAPAATSKYANVSRDLIAGLVVFLVALPLCLGIALASDAPPISGLLAGILGGLVVGAISGSKTSVSGPAAGLAAIVVMQQQKLGSFEAFLLAVFIAGLLQIALGLLKAGELSAFVPSSVIKGLLAAIGVLLILKQIPHLMGHVKEAAADAASTNGGGAVEAADGHGKGGHNPLGPFIEIGKLFTTSGATHVGASTIGFISLLMMIVWDRIKFLKGSLVPDPLVVVIVGVGIQVLLGSMSETWALIPKQLVTIPEGKFTEFFSFPDWSQITNPVIYTSAITVALVASLETLLNLEAVDKLAPEKVSSPPSRELIAQGCGNATAGLIGALPITSVIVRGSVNVAAGAKTKLSAIFHGFLLITFVAALPFVLKMIPLSGLAAILLYTGFKLASPTLFRQMWRQGKQQFVPFLVTLVAIVLTDLLVGAMIGLGVAAMFILNSNLKQPIRKVVETHLEGDVLHVILANHVTFLNRAALDSLFNEAKPGTHLVIDATDTHYIDPDVLSLIRDFRDVEAKARGIKVSMRGFRDRYEMKDEIQYADFSTSELQDRATPEQVLKLLLEGNRRFRTDDRLSRDFSRQITGTAKGQNPLAVILSCIDSRVPAELVFDLGIGDIFSVRVAGNVIGTKSLGSMEYAVAAAGVKLVLVLGHTRCGAVTSSLELADKPSTAEQAPTNSCTHLGAIVNELNHSIEAGAKSFAELDDASREALIDEVARRNVLRTCEEILSRSSPIREAVEAGNAIIVGAIYDVASGAIELLNDVDLNADGSVETA